MKSLNTLKQVDDTDNESNKFPYWPVCEVWQNSMCQLLGIRFVRVHTKYILIYSINYFPAVTGRILGDGNCFFRALAFLVTQVLKIIIFNSESYIVHNA